VKPGAEVGAGAGVVAGVVGAAVVVGGVCVCVVVVVGAGAVFGTAAGVVVVAEDSADLGVSALLVEIPIVAFTSSICFLAPSTKWVGPFSKRVKNAPNIIEKKRSQQINRNAFISLYGNTRLKICQSTNNKFGNSIN
jgi:hypothetical protein